MHKFDVPYRITIGKRSNGKTYAVKKVCINGYGDGKGKFVYIRRRHKQVTRKLMVKLFSDINEYAMEHLGDYINYTTESGFFITNENGDRETIGFATSVEDAFDFKGIPYNEVTTIFFDEFLEYGTAIEDEIGKFLNIVSTIVRQRDNVNIYMIANTITKDSPYFRLFGIDSTKLKKGKIAYIKHNAGVEAALEYCDNEPIVESARKNIGKTTGASKYLGFDDNPVSNMILYGEWEYDAVNVKDIDGIGWNTDRAIIPMYFTALKQVYEMSIHIDQNPIAYVRKLNTQNGFVKEQVQYNLSYDDSLILSNKHGIVPLYGKVNELIAPEVRRMFEIFMLAVQAKRVVFDTISTGSDFLKLIKTVA